MVPAKYLHNFALRQNTTGLNVTTTVWNKNSTLTSCILTPSTPQPSTIITLMDPLQIPNAESQETAKVLHSIAATQSSSLPLMTTTVSNVASSPPCTALSPNTPEPSKVISVSSQSELPKTVSPVPTKPLHNTSVAKTSTQSNTKRKRKWTGTNCCVHGCGNITGMDKDLGVSRSYYEFPLNDREKCETWLSHMPQAKEKDWRPSKHSRICSDHFVGGEWNTSNQKEFFYLLILGALNKVQRR